MSTDTKNVVSNYSKSASTTDTFQRAFENTSSVSWDTQTTLRPSYTCDTTAGTTWRTDTNAEIDWFITTFIVKTGFNTDVIGNLCTLRHFSHEPTNTKTPLTSDYLNRTYTAILLPTTKYTHIPDLRTVTN